jgi:hypothetical protein
MATRLCYEVEDRTFRGNRGIRGITSVIRIGRIETCKGRGSTGNPAKVDDSEERKRTVTVQLFPRLGTHPMEFSAQKEDMLYFLDIIKDQIQRLS